MAETALVAKLESEGNEGRADDEPNEVEEGPIPSTVAQILDMCMFCVVLMNIAVLIILQYKTRVSVSVLLLDTASSASHRCS